jgi:hypothetical protein
LDEVTDAASHPVRFRVSFTQKERDQVRNLNVIQLVIDLGVLVGGVQVMLPAFLSMKSEEQILGNVYIEIVGRLSDAPGVQQISDRRVPGNQFE